MYFKCEMYLGCEMYLKCDKENAVSVELHNLK